MRFMTKQIIAMLLIGFFAVSAHAQDEYQPTFTDLELSVDMLDSSLFLAANGSASTQSSSVPNIPDSAFSKPVFTENNVHMVLGLASLAMAGITGLTADSVGKDNGSAALKTNVHVVAAKAAWQLGALAIGTGLWTHWDDFHLEDGLLDRDNLHVLLGTLGVIGYYMAVNSAVNDYNTNSGSVTTDHASYGILGGAAMITGIVFTW